MQMQEPQKKGKRGRDVVYFTIGFTEHHLAVGSLDGALARPCGYGYRSYRPTLAEHLWQVWKISWDPNLESRVIRGHLHTDRHGYERNKRRKSATSFSFFLKCFCLLLLTKIKRFAATNLQIGLMVGDGEVGRRSSPLRWRSRACPSTGREPYQRDPGRPWGLFGEEE